jgi:hypothetical protein
MDADRDAVLNSMPKPAQQARAQPRSTAVGLGTSLLKAAVAIAGAVDQSSSSGGQGGGGGGGGGGAGNGVDFSAANMAFQQSLQNNMWSSVNNAANF